MLAKIRKIGSIGLMLYYLLVLAVPMVVNAQTATTPTTAAAPAATPAPQGPDPNGAATGGISDLTGFNSFKDIKNPTTLELAAAVGHNRVAINIMWTLITGFLVMFMQAGFAMVETGMTRAKNVNHTMTMNFMIYPFGMLGFYVCGFAFMFGGLGTLGTLGGYAGLSNEFTIHPFGPDKPFGLIGLVGYFLTGPAYDVAVFTLFLFQMVFMDTTATIPTGAMAERWKWSAFCLYGCAIGTIMYPVFGNWVWGGGWLAQLGANFGLGHGYCDFAGSTVVHMQGGVIALIGALIIGPRIGKFNKNGSANTIPAHNMPMAIAGCFILAFGWFGFNPGSTLAGADLRISVVAVNTMLASAWGALASMLYIWFVRGKKPDPGMMVNGMLAGLVAITGPSAFVSATGATIIGLVSGVLVVESCFFVERVLKVDDPVGAISVHGTNGAWGCLSLGLLADGTYGQGWNGVLPNKGVTGLFYGDSSQFIAQIIGVVTCFITLSILAYIVFKVIDVTVGNRVDPKVELEGLDVPEMGSVGYCGVKMDPASENITSH
jgi:Amt family ammonium transporter